MRPLLLALSVFVVLVTGFLAIRDLSSRTRTFVDGWPIGECRSVADAQYDAFARTTLDGLDPNHAAVESIDQCSADFLGTRGEHVLFTRSGGGSIVAVMHLADGSTRGFYIGCGVGLATEMCFNTPDANQFMAEWHVH